MAFLDRGTSGGAPNLILDIGHKRPRGHQKWGTSPFWARGTKIGAPKVDLELSRTGAPKLGTGAPK